MPRKKGTPKTGGRVKGQPNKTTGAIADWCRSVIENPAYQDYLRHRLMVGQLAPVLEGMLWHYGYGKPVETTRLTGADGGPVLTRVVDEIHR